MHTCTGQDGKAVGRIETDLFCIGTSANLISAPRCDLFDLHAWGVNAIRWKSLFGEQIVLGLGRHRLIRYLPG